MHNHLKIAALGFAVAGLALAAGCSSQQTFKTPEAAVAALKTAVEDQDINDLRALFGPKAAELKSGDPDEDHDDAIVFARRLAESSVIQEEGPDVAVLLIGKEQWPFAVPLVKKDGSWRFDTEAGLEEIAVRRIGRNELLTIAACNTLMDAQAEYYLEDHGQGGPQYARKLMSSEGKKDGLYWPVTGNEDPSPIGPVLAEAMVRRNDLGDLIPFNGYFYRPLTRQGPAAPGGTMDYEQDGKLTRGWAAMAYPAEYDKTGIMTFIFSGNGMIYQKDLGHDTSAAALGIDSFDPGDGWIVVGP